MRHRQHGLVFMRIAISVDGGVGLRIAQRVHAAHLFLADALRTRVTGDASAALRQHGAQQFDALICAPRRQIDIQPSGHHHDAVAALAMPRQPRHGLRSQHAGQHIACKRSALRPQAFRIHPTQAHLHDAGTGGIARHPATPVAEHHRRQQHAAGEQPRPDHRVAHERRKRLARGQRAVEVEQGQVRHVRALTRPRQACVPFPRQSSSAWRASWHPSAAAPPAWCSASPAASSR